MLLLMAGKGCAVPGSPLGTEEEFVAGAGAQAAADGTIHATVCGTTEISADKTVSVKAKVQLPRQLKRGMEVYGRVEEIFEPIALVQIAPKSERAERQIPPEGYTVIHAREIRNGYVENVRDELHIGDIVKATVLDIRRDGEISLTMKPPGMGVVKAFCSRCRNPLALQQDGALKCGRCGSIERRKLAPEYPKP